MEEKLHHALLSRRAEILESWTSQLRLAATETTPVTTIELIDHVPQFLDELIEALRLAEEEPAVAASQTSTAGQHGIQRFRLGFDIDAVVREYGLLQRCIVDVAARAGVRLSPDDFQMLGDSISSGIADAVTQYSRQRDAELRRQANEHFAFVAHELRNPLASAQLALELSKTRGLLAAGPISDLLGRGLARTRDLIENALQLARMNDGTEPRREPVALRDLVAEAVSESEVAAHIKEIRIEVPDQQDVVVEIDRKLVLSAVTNIVGNAVKFTRKGGRISIRWIADDDRVLIDVRDGCGGLPEGATEKLFAPFVQAGSDRSGFGLGLAIARQAIQAHGGELRVHNHPGDGCTFSIELPGQPLLHGSRTP
jgi:signal transduction histidine kinase